MLRLAVAEIAEFPNYRVWNTGAVESRMVGKRWKILTPRNNGRDYLSITLCGHEKARTTVYIHRLVLANFGGVPPFTGACARHKDGRRGNNWISNLEWGTYKQNEDDKHSHGTWGARVTNGKLSEEDRKAIREMRRNGIRMTTIAEKFKVSRPTISRMLAGATWRQI